MQYNALHNYSEGENVTIALIDSGISIFQKDDAKKSVVSAEDCTEYDSNGHGTMMLSLLRGYKDSISGISPNASVYSYKVVSNSGKIKGIVLAEAIKQAHTDGVDIINISLGSYHESDEVMDAIKDAWQDGIIIVASAGDYGANDMLFPANCDYVISVGAIDSSGGIWENTNTHSKCDILAPGVSILAIDNAEKKYYSSGTSQATVLISGYIALLISYSKKHEVNLTYQDICEILQRINSGESTYLKELANVLSQ